MQASGHVGFENCPSCGGPATGRCLDEIGCPLRIAPTPAFATDLDRDTTARAEVLVDLFEQAILDTAAALKLADPRKAAALVADAWANVLREEGRRSRTVESAAAAVRGIGEQMHRRESSTVGTPPLGPKVGTPKRLAEEWIVRE
jgi:hypothetical protein